MIFPSAVSMRIVTGPSLVKETSIIAPNLPVSTWTPAAVNFSLKISYISSAFVGCIAFVKLGRLPLRISAYKVNCEIERMLPARSEERRVGKEGERWRGGDDGWQLM